MSAVTDVQTVLNDAGVFWPVAQIYDALNEAQLAIYGETKWAITQGHITLSSNVDVVPLPPNILIPKWIEGTNTQFQPPVIKRSFFTTQRGLEHFLRQWRGNNLGQPTYCTIWDATHMRVFPRPDGAGPGPGGTYPITVFGVGFPSEISTQSQDIIGPRNYRQAIINLTVSLLLEATRPDLADVYLAQSTEQLLAFKKQLRNQQSHNIRVLRPAMTRYEIDQAGEVYELPSYYPLEA